MTLRRRILLLATELVTAARQAALACPALALRVTPA